MTLLYTYTFHAGTSDSLKPVDGGLWARAYLTQTVEAPPFYTRAFQMWADDILSEDFGLTQADISPLYCKELYLYLISLEPPTL